MFRRRISSPSMAASLAVGIIAIPVLFLACTETPTAPAEAELDCSSPWSQELHSFIVYESDLPYDLGSQGIAAQDRVTVKYEGAHGPQKVIAYHQEETWMIALRPDGADWQSRHVVEQLMASRPGCTEEHGAIVLLFEGSRPPENGLHASRAGPDIEIQVVHRPARAIGILTACGSRPRAR